MMKIPFRSAPIASTVLAVAVALLGATGCKKSDGVDAAAEAAFQAEQQKALDARTAAERECESLPGAAREDCRSVAGAEYERVVGEAKDRRENGAP